VTARVAVRSPAFRPQGPDADPFRDAKRLRLRGGTTNCAFHSFSAPQLGMTNSLGLFIVYGPRTGNDRTFLSYGGADLTRSDASQSDLMLARAVYVHHETEGLRDGSVAFPS
jgi:hypothetical protein